MNTYDEFRIVSVSGPISSRVRVALGGDRNVIATEVTAAAGRFRTAMIPPEVSTMVVICVVFVETVMLLVELEKGDVVMYSATAVGGYVRSKIDSL